MPDQILAAVNAVLFFIAAAFCLRLIWFHVEHGRNGRVYAFLIIAFLAAIWPAAIYGIIAVKQPPPEFTSVWLRPWASIIALGTMGLTAVAYRYGEQRAVQKQFVDNVSHELRTPLNVILGFSDLGDPQHMQTIHRSAQRMRFLVENILGESMLKHGRLETGMVDLSAAVLESANSLRLMAENKGVALKTDLQTVFVTGNESFLVLLANNLIDNAIKFSPNGTVLAATFARGGRGYFIVEDDGIGMDDKVLGIAFKRFRQGDGSDTRLFSGVGLGLYFVQQIVTAHQGSIRMESEPGKGTAVIVSLPLWGQT